MSERIAYEKKEHWEAYYKQLGTEILQCREEGKDMTKLQPLFEAIQALDDCEEKARLADAAFALIEKTPTVEGYPYTEPNGIEEIRALRKGSVAPVKPDAAKLKDKLTGAWLGRICGCSVGKVVEGIRTDDLIPFLKESGNYPMHRYVLKSDLKGDYDTRYKFRFAQRTSYVDTLTAAPVDDDTNYTVLAQELIKKYGRDFTSDDVAAIWLARQPKTAYCTAERVAYLNFLKGYQPPDSATYENAFREWIGAQIRGDYFGYINPGDPAAAAEMAWRDARISHVKNGIYGEMFAAAMIAEAAVTDDIKLIIKAGMGEIPATSRLYKELSELVSEYDAGASKEAAFAKIHSLYDEHTGHGWCHTISNALIVCAGLLYGNGDFGASTCMAVETGFDTDCNGATIGSVLGMRGGRDSIGEYWRAPFHDTLDTSIIGVGKVTVESVVETTLTHISL